MSDLQVILDAIVPYIGMSACLGFFLALVQKLVRFVIGMILGGRMDV